MSQKREMREKLIKKFIAFIPSIALIAFIAFIGLTDKKREMRERPIAIWLVAHGGKKRRRAGGIAKEARSETWKSEVRASEPQRAERMGHSQNG